MRSRRPVRAGGARRPGIGQDADAAQRRPLRDARARRRARQIVLVKLESQLGRLTARRLGGTSGVPFEAHSGRWEYDGDVRIGVRGGDSPVQGLIRGILDSDTQ